MTVIRFGVSLEEDLLKALDQYVIDNSFPNRSQAIRKLIEKNLVEKKWQCNHIVAGAIVLTYNHHKNELVSQLMDIQHDYEDIVLSSEHFHLENDLCLEIVAVKGPSFRLTDLSDKLIALKGLLHGKLIMSRVE